MKWITEGRAEIGHDVASLSLGTSPVGG